MVWSIVALLAAAVVVVARWALRRTDALGRPRRFPVVGVVLLVVPAAVLAVPVVRHHRLEDRLGRVASELVGHRVDVHCQTAGEQFVHVGAELGYVAFGPDGRPEPRTVLAREACAALAAYLAGDRRDPSREEVVAVHVLSHEARHLAGTIDEARAECEAVQRDALTARLLGAGDEQAHRLARLYWAVEHPGLPGNYRSADCAAGAAWDERLPDAPWSRTSG